MFSQETYKIFNRPYALLSFLAVLLMGLLFAVAFADEGKEYYKSFVDTFNKTVTFEGNLINGNLFAYKLINSIWAFIPFVIVFVSASTIAEDKNSGMLRVILAGSITRGKYYSAKFFSSIFFILLLILLLTGITLGLGLALFGSGELLTYNKGQFVLLSHNEALIRFAFAFAYYFFVLTALASVSLFFSAIIDNPIKAVLATSITVLTLFFISYIEIPFLDGIKPFLFTSYFYSWIQLFDLKIDQSQIFTDISILVTYSILFYFIGTTTFNKKEILN
jgi:ABC-2 type transport system permease protein